MNLRATMNSIVRFSWIGAHTTGCDILCMLQMECTQKSRGYVSDILKLLRLLVKYFLKETALWLLCGGRYWRGGHEVDVQVFQSVAASTLINRSAVAGETNETKLLIIMLAWVEGIWPHPLVHHTQR